MADSTAPAKPPVAPKKDKTLGQPSASEETASLYPKMDLCQKMHRLTAAKHAGTLDSLLELQTEVFTAIAVDLVNPSLYRRLQLELYGAPTPSNAAAALKLTTDDLDQLQVKQEKELATLEAAVTDAQENAGDMEVVDARVKVARFAAQSLAENVALDAYEKLLDVPKLSSGKKIDALMEQARVASFYKDTSRADDCIARADKIANEGSGGDWDRRNRLKVYKALQRLLHRDMQAAAEALLSCIATFSCNEICSYGDFIVYTMLTNLLHLKRPELKVKIIDGPEVLSVANHKPVVIKLVNAYYDCDYKTYLNAMVEVEQVLLDDRYLQPHAAYWMRELHLLAYQQFLESYQSVRLDAMANAFGVSVDFIDTYASRFIASNRLSAKIDKFGGVIVTNRPDRKNAQYRDMIQKGDLLLNRIQKLARVVDL
jgi:26S proteasome regulatory subunit N7